MSGEAPGPRRRSILVRLLLLVVLLAVLGAAAAGGTVWWAWQRFNAPGPLVADTTLLLEQGDGLGTIASRLKAGGIISGDDPFGLGLLDDATIFKLGVRYRENHNRLKFGEYAIPARASMAEVMDLLVAGKVIQYGLTIPEGRTSAMIMRAVAADPVLVGDAGTLAPAEGSLLPETYLFTRGTTRAELIDRMADDHRKLAEALWAKRKPGLPYDTLEQAVILASIVEKETGVASERPQVASVFVNRLRKGMRLQSDPTIIYGITGGEPLGRGIRRSELDRATPYNTYIIDGLPPTPICNPGRASLEAVMNPPETDYLFFVADGTGGHAFSVTLAEHERNVARWREIERERAAAATRGSAE
jgi:UPF0755 protein